MLCYRDFVVCTAYVDLNLDVNTIFYALDRTNGRFYKRQSLFIYMPPQDRNARDHAVLPWTLVLSLSSYFNVTAQPNDFRGRKINNRQEISLRQCERGRVMHAGMASGLKRRFDDDDDDLSHITLRSMSKI